MRHATTLAILLLAACGSEPPTDAGVDAGGADAGAASDAGPDTLDPRCAPLREAVRAADDEYDVPGHAFAQVLDGEVACVVSEGAASDDTVFAWTHLSRLLMSLTALQMSAHGELDLDATVESLVGPLDLEPADWASAITVRHLVWEESGIAPGSSYEIERCTEDGDTIEGFGASHDDGGRVLQAPPGIRHARLARAEGILLGRVIAVAGEGSFAEVVRRVLFEPLGMSDSWAGWSAELAARDVVGHIPGDPLVQRVDGTTQACEAAQPLNGMFSTIGDASRLLTVLVRGGLGDDGERLLAESTVDALFERRLPHQWSSTLGSVPGGLGRYDDGPAPLVSWVGRMRGFTASIALSVEEGFGVVELTNLEQWRSQLAATEAATSELGWLYPNDIYEPPATWDPPLEELREYEGDEGIYVSPVSCQALSVNALEGALLIEGQRWRPVDRDRFAPDDGSVTARVGVWRDDAGEIYVVTAPSIDNGALAFYPQGQVPDELKAISECTNLDPDP